ncbi:hypothetical protein BBJ28_00009896 [Nothophytophthora sp. Chile5]|nr:hypothetical protein BBJ28_00009896 [Nothophytophthora sp. Chile5]
MARQVLNYHDVQLYDSDVALFASRQWLNDNALNFYFQYLYQTLCLRGDGSNSDVLPMDPAVVSCMLHQCEDDDEYADLARGLDLQNKQLCLIPVSDNAALDGQSSHWSLLVFRSGRFEHFDSSGGLNSRAAQRIASTFEVLLRAVGRHDGDQAGEKVEDVADAPQQQNGYDCGMYVLVLAEYFCRRHANESVPPSLQAYATPERVTQLRLQMPALVQKLQQAVAQTADVAKVAEVAGQGKTFRWCQRQAQRLNCLVTCGYVEEDSGLLYNSMMVVGPDGALECNPRKTFLYETDKSWATAGDGFLTWHCPWLNKTISFGICMDINPDDFKAPFSAYEFGSHVVTHASDLVLFACAWNDFEPHDVTPYRTLSYWGQRLSPVIDALANDAYGKPNCHFLCANRIGSENGTFFVGASCAMSLKEPAVLAHVGRRTEELLRVEIPDEATASDA